MSIVEYCSDTLPYLISIVESLLDCSLTLTCIVELTSLLLLILTLIVALVFERDTPNTV